MSSLPAKNESFTLVPGETAKPTTPSSYGDVYTSVVRSEEPEEMARRQAAIRVFTLPDTGVYLRAAAYHPLSNYRCRMRIFFSALRT